MILFLCAILFTTTQLKRFPSSPPVQVLRLDVVCSRVGSQRDREREIFNGGQLFHHYTYYIPLNNRRSCLENRETCKVEFESAIANYGSKNRHCQFIVQLLYQSQSNDNSRFKESAIRSLIWEMSLDKKTCFLLFNELIPLNLSLFHSRGRINKIIIIITSDQTTT